MDPKVPMTCIVLGSCTVMASAAAMEEAKVRPAVPVMITANEDGDACANGVVHGLDPRGDGFLAVKAGPGLGYKRIDKLYNGEQVYLCGFKGDWFAIVYTKQGDGSACNVTKPWPRSMPYTGPCRSGWVHRRWIEVTAE